MIPPIIHQIWIGPKPIPENCRGWCERFKTMNPGWRHTLHGSELLERYASDPFIRSMQATEEKVAFVTDRLRVLLLRDEGGIYIDSDAEPVRPLATLNRVWNGVRTDFVTGMRPPDRRFVALHRGVSFVDNTVMASARQGRMILRLCALYTSDKPKQTGYTQGLEVLRSADETTVLMNYRYFYSETIMPETVLLHDGHNLGSWGPKKPLAQASFIHAHAPCNP